MKIGITEKGDGGLNQRWRDNLEFGLVDGAIIITKAPQLLLEKPLPNNTVINCTITGHGGTIIEPNVAPIKETLEAYYTLLELYGEDRVVLRIDPILPDPDPSLKVFNQAKEQLGYIPKRIRISFMDLYPHVLHRFRKAGLEDSLKIYNDDFHLPLEFRKNIWGQMDKPEVCGEPDFPCLGCVSPLDVKAMGLNINELSQGKSQQRFSCHCIAEKVELLSSKKPCQHNCLYCYWRG